MSDRIIFSIAAIEIPSLPILESLLKKGGDIVESMYGNISGDAIPRYIATAGGKIPLHRSNVIGRDGADLILRKPWSQEAVKYPDANPDEYDRPDFSFTKQG
jgi:lysine 2,3-aminomutase